MKGDYCDGLRMITPPPAPSVLVVPGGGVGADGAGPDGAGGAAVVGALGGTGIARRPSMGIS